MPKPKRLSGADIVSIFRRFGFAVARQRGSHATLVRDVLGAYQILIVPMHKELRTGAVVGVFRQALRYIPEKELRKYFYSGD